MIDELVPVEFDLYQCFQTHFGKPITTVMERNHPCQILCQSVKGFLAGNTAKSAISYTFLNDPYNSSALPCRQWCDNFVLGISVVKLHAFASTDSVNDVSEM